MRGGFGFGSPSISRSIAARCSRIDLEGDDDRPEPLSADSSVKDWFGHPVVGPALMAGMLANATEEQRAAAEDNANLLRMVESMPMSQFARFPGVDLSEATLRR